MTKRLLILTVAAAISAASAGSALAAKPAILLPGGTYLNQAATSGLSCLGGSSAATGTTTFIVSVPSSQSSQGVTLKVDYDFDPADPALPSYSGGAVIRAQAPSGVAVQTTVPVAIPVTGDDGSKATVVNATVISITSDGVLLFDAASLASWSCGAVTPASVGSGGGCAAAAPLYAQLILETAGARGDLQKKAIESQRECAKGKTREAARKIGDFLKELARQAPKLDAGAVAHWSEEATAIRSALVG